MGMKREIMKLESNGKVVRMESATATWIKFPVFWGAFSRYLRRNVVLVVNDILNK